MSVIVIEKDEDGNNKRFKDINTGAEMTKNQFVKAIKKDENGYQEGYHIRTINGVETPVSNPNSKKSDNLG